MKPPATFMVKPATALRRRQELTCFSIAVLALGLLLWGRFMLVTGYPRTATARPLGEPAAVTAATHPAAGPASGGDSSAAPELTPPAAPALTGVDADAAP